MQAREITKHTNLCTEDGQLNPDSIGWARQPLIHCNVKGSFLRKKKWNYWCVTSPDFLFSVTISHIDYAAVLFVYILDFKTLEFHEKTVLVPFAKSIHMPEDVRSSVKYEGKELNISFNEDGEDTHIQVQCPNFSGKGKSLLADITLKRPSDYESLNVVVPWSDHRFQFTSKQPAIPTEGTVTWDNKTYICNENESFGCLDYGRGIWRYQSKWNWASASGVVHGKLIGLNFGGQWTDGTGQNENGIMIDGKLHKIHEDITWEYSKKNFMEPWVLKTATSDKVSLTFTPFYERIAATKALIIHSEVHQMIGRFNGYITSTEGEKITIEAMIGWAEDHIARW